MFIVIFIMLLPFLLKMLHRENNIKTSQKYYVVIMFIVIFIMLLPFLLKMLHGENNI